MNTPFHSNLLNKCPILIHYEKRLVLCFNLKEMTRITENEFARICQGIYTDSESICQHNPIGTKEEILLWMLMCCLISYLNLPEIETPCFNDDPNDETYRQAILFILRDRMAEHFDPEKYLSQFNN